MPLNGSVVTNHRKTISSSKIWKFQNIIVSLPKIGEVRSGIEIDEEEDSHKTALVIENASDGSRCLETYLNFINACNILQDAFGKTKLDVVTKKGLSPYIGKAILNEVEYV